MKKSCMENDPAKENLGREPSACDLHQAAGALQSSCTDINHRSTAIKILSITSGLTDLYIDLFFVIYKAHNIKSFVVSGKQLLLLRQFLESDFIHQGDI